MAAAFQASGELVDVNYKQKLQPISDLICSAYDRYQAEMKRIDPSFFVEPEASQDPGEQNIITVACWGPPQRSSEEDAVIEGCLNVVLSRLSDIAHTFKADAFSEEREVRLVSKVPANGSQLERIELRARGNELIPYLEMKPTTGTLPIQRVIFGPASKSFGQTYALKALLTKFGHEDVQIQPSRFALQ